jgi:hypothetical protein
MNLDIELDAKRGDAWNGKHEPQIEVTFDEGGKVGIWVSDGGHNTRTVCWCDLPPSVIRTIAAVAQTWPLQPEEP